jgi:hypothetical protein
MSDPCSTKIGVIMPVGANTADTINTEINNFNTANYNTVAEYKGGLQTIGNMFEVKGADCTSAFGGTGSSLASSIVAPAGASAANEIIDFKEIAGLKQIIKLITSDPNFQEIITKLKTDQKSKNALNDIGITAPMLNALDSILPLIDQIDFEKPNSAMSNPLVTAFAVKHVNLLPSVTKLVTQITSDPKFVEKIIKILTEAAAEANPAAAAAAAAPPSSVPTLLPAANGAANGAAAANGAPAAAAAAAKAANTPNGVVDVTGTSNGVVDVTGTSNGGGTRRRRKNRKNAKTAKLRKSRRKNAKK